MQLYIQDRRNPSVYIEFVRDDETGKLYLWDVQKGRVFTWEEIDQILAFFKEYIDNVSQEEIEEINKQLSEEEEEINQQLRQKKMEERYLGYLENYSYYTEHVLSKEYHADLHGHVVCYETENGYIHFDCTKKTKHKTLPELLNHLRRKHKVRAVHLVFEATEAKKLCAWLDNVFAPGIRRGVFSAEEEIVPLKPYEPDFKEYLIQALKEHRCFPKGIKDLIIDTYE